MLFMPSVYPAKINEDYNLLDKYKFSEVSSDEKMKNDKFQTPH